MSTRTEFSVTDCGCSADGFMRSTRPSAIEISDFYARVRHDIETKRSPLVALADLKFEDLHPWLQVARWTGWWFCRHHWDLPDFPRWDPRPIEVALHPLTHELSKFLNSFVGTELSTLSHGFIRCGRRWVLPNDAHRAHAPTTAETSRCWRALGIALSLGLNLKLSATAAAGSVEHPWLILFLAFLRKERIAGQSVADALESEFRRISIQRLQEAVESDPAPNEASRLDDWCLPNYLTFFKFAFATLRLGEFESNLASSFFSLQQDSVGGIWPEGVREFLYALQDHFRKTQRAPLLAFLEQQSGNPSLPQELKDEISNVINQIRSGATFSEALKVNEGLLSHPLLTAAAMTFDSGREDVFAVLHY